jgi:predicted kinase
VNEPVLRIVIGTAGSGKSTVAQRLAEEHGAAYLDKDTLGARFVDAALLAGGYEPGDRESNAYYREHLLSLEYDSLLDVAGANLRLGHSVVVDAPFTPYLAEPHYIIGAAERLAWPPRVRVDVVSVRVGPRLLRKRLESRALDRDRWKLANWDEYWSEHGERLCLWEGVRLTEMRNE